VRIVLLADGSSGSGSGPSPGDLAALMRAEGAADGLLDVVIIPAGPRRRLAGDAHAMRRGRIGARPGVTRARAEEVVVGLPPGTALNVDGEIVPAGGPLRSQPGRFRLVVS
jgi:diacylglycerol kinase family enzyme